VTPSPALRGPEFGAEQDLSLKTLQNQLHSICTKWFILGVQLEIAFGTLKRINQECREDAGQCLVELLHEWLKNKPCWKDLVDALRSPAVNEKSLAENIGREHCPYRSLTDLHEDVGDGLEDHSTRSPYSASAPAKWQRYVSKHGYRRLSELNHLPDHLPESDPKVLQAAIAVLSNYVGAQTSSTATPSQQEVDDVASTEPRISEPAQPPLDSPQSQLVKPQPVMTPSPALRGPEFDKRPTAKEFLSLIWKNGERTEEIRIMDEVKPRWRDFGIALGFSIGDLDAIELGCRMPDHCIQSVFGDWSRKMSSTYHWKGFITALKKAGFPDLATRVTYAVEHPRMPSTLGKLFIKSLLIYIISVNY